MQTNIQDLSLMLGSSAQAGTTGVASVGKTQPIGIKGEGAGEDFLASLESSLQALTQGDQAAVPIDPAQMLAAIEQYLSGQGQLPGGNGLPLEGEAGDAGLEQLNADLTELAAQLRAFLGNGAATAGGPPAQPLQPQVATPFEPLPAANAPGAQAQLDQRRLFERFQALPEVRQAAGGLPAGALQRVLARLEERGHEGAAVALGNGWISDLKSALAVTPPGVQGDDFAAQMSKMAQLNSVALNAQDGVAVGHSLKEGDAAGALAAAGLQRAAAPATAASEARPATATAIQLPFHDPRWQNEFADRVTWLARAGGNQSAEIRLNPAHLGPIEVRVMMNDDQASITFSAQHGVVRDAIEASLPRLRELFSGSGLQLAQANVSDQPLQDQRQRQQQGFASGNGRGQEWQGQGEEFGELVTPLNLSASRPPTMAERLDIFA